jgi:C4-dicarboxylate transporter DctM subunit
MTSAYILMGGAFLFLFLGSPTFLGFGLLMSIASLYSLGLSPQAVALDLWSNIDSFTFLAMPLFIFAGSLMTYGNSSKYLVGFVNTFVRQFHGGLAMVVVISCGFFAAMSGSVIATAAAIGLVMHKLMVAEGYPKEFSGAVIAGGAILGPIIPPSIWMIIYCSMAEANVAKMFMAGFIPGILIIGIEVAIIYFMARRRNFPVIKAATWQERSSAFVKGIPALAAPFIILGGIYGGIFTPTESGAVACIWALLTGIFIYKGLNNFKQVLDMSKEAAYITANIGLLIATAIILGAVASRLGVAQAFANFLKGMGLGPTGFLLAFTGLLIFLGFFLEAICIMVITVPLLFPTASQLGVDPLQFGMVLTIGLGVGQMTPPVGITVYTVAKFTEQPSGPVFGVITPLTLGVVLIMILVSIFPQLSLWLPRVLLG